MGAFDTRLVRYNQQVVVALQDEVYILLTEWNSCAIVNDYIRKERVGLLERFVNFLLIKLKFAHSEASKYHQRTYKCDHYSHLPAEYGTDQYWEEQSKACFSNYTSCFSGQTVDRLDILCNHISQNTRCSIFVVKPSNVLVQKGIEELDT